MHHQIRTPEQRHADWVETLTPEQDEQRIHGTNHVPTPPLHGISPDDYKRYTGSKGLW